MFPEFAFGTSGRQDAAFDLGRCVRLGKPHICLSTMRPAGIVLVRDRRSLGHDEKTSLSPQ